jgi:hypothetical protein
MRIYNWVQHLPQEYILVLLHFSLNSGIGVETAAALARRGARGEWQAQSERRLAL